MVGADGAAGRERPATPRPMPLPSMWTAQGLFGRLHTGEIKTPTPQVGLCLLRTAPKPAGKSSTGRRLPPAERGARRGPSGAGACRRNNAVFWGSINVDQQ